MTHTQFIAMGLWQAVAPVVFGLVCAFFYFWWAGGSNNDDDDDDDDGDAPGLFVELVEHMPIGFHRAKGNAA